MAAPAVGHMVTMDSSSRAGGRIRGLAGALAALVVVAGVLVAAVSASYPIRIRHTVPVPQLREQGDFDKQLVPTGSTEPMAKADTCIPLRQVLAIGGSHDPAVCRSRDTARLTTAKAGLGVAGLGLVAVVVLLIAGLLADRRRRQAPDEDSDDRAGATRPGPRPLSTPAPR